jgi:iron complex outermembrane receptor protein
VTKRLDEATFYGVNAGRTDHMGLELSGRWVIYRPINLQADFGYWLPSNRFDKFIDDGNDYSGNNLPGIADQTTFIGLTATPTVNWHISINYYYTGKQFLNDANTGYANSWQKLDVRLTRKIKTTPNTSLKLTVGSQNLLDEKYASMIAVNAPSINNNLPRYFYPASPRTFFGGIILTHH